MPDKRLAPDPDVLVAGHGELSRPRVDLEFMRGDLTFLRETIGPCGP